MSQRTIRVTREFFGDLVSYLRPEERWFNGRAIVLRSEDSILMFEVGEPVDYYSSCNPAPDPDTHI